ncbi:MAG TPA: CopG family ribbon-helix-helix protein [Rhizomicrobium sp.]|nr:CopG family ribbon-helix-helix protein [Rhizomicrobium sp.]
MSSSALSRISMTLPERTLSELDRMVAARGFESRSQAIGDILHQSIVEHQRELGDAVMAGVITLLYSRKTPGLQKMLADLQAHHIDEVISSLHIQLKDRQIMEVILVQGPASKLQVISNAMGACRGVVSSHMHLMAALIPQIHPFKGRRVRRKK